jgi:hypothetical protein
MNTPEEFYKKLLAYDNELDLDEPSPLTHKGVIHFMSEYSNQLHKLSVGGPASASALEGEQLGNEGSAKSVSVELTDEDIKWLHQKPVDTDWIKGYDRA